MSRYSRGGMITKLEAARIATQAGGHMILADGRQPHNLSKLIQGTQNCTFFKANQAPHDARKSWIAGSLQSDSQLHIDAGAAQALANGKSLLPIGVVRVDGQFERGTCVAILDPNGQEIARGLVEHDDKQAREMMGKQTDEIQENLNYYGRGELVHRDNMVLTHHTDKP